LCFGASGPAGNPIAFSVCCKKLNKEIG